MRSRLDRQLDEMKQNLIEMGSCCENCIGQVALTLQDIANENVSDGHEKSHQMINKIYESDAEIDKLERLIESECLRLLLEQQPVARDLRYISSALKMISDLERIGDQCSDIADIAEYLYGTKQEKLESATRIQDMASATMRMVTRAVDSFIQKDLALAKSVQASDDIVDNMFDEIKTEIVGLISRYPNRGEVLLDLLMVAKYFERIGDHATNVAEWVEFSITGERPQLTKYAYDEKAMEEIKITRENRSIS
ncbi:MAG TPA: phosphate transport system regulatory protein PhoU [Oribacterium sp.]|nr:phosphate transport system regulatory protein PhoU [Oribacterium sp.]HCS67485.1 phosphate transport system regulatory protein PhoU [Oribacterium sp.]